MKKWGFRAFGVWAAVLCLTLGGVSAAFGASAPAPVYRIVTLGDSLAAGYEPGMTEQSVPYGYAERLYEQALFHGRAKLANYGIIGLRTEGLTALLQGAANGKILKAADIQDFSMFEDQARIAALADAIGARTAELKTSLDGANLVVITIGANDFGDFLKSLITGTGVDVEAALEGEFLTKVNKYTEDAENAVRQVHTLAPRARILISDQYLPVPKLFAPELYDTLYEKAVAPLTAAVEALAAKLQGEGLQVQAVHIADRFKGEEGSLTHMSISLFGEVKPDIHPTQAGYEAMAEVFAQAVWKEYRKPKARPAGVPVSVVIAGKEMITVNKPLVKNNTTYVALSDLMKATGAQMKWTAKTKTAVIRKNGQVVSLTIGAKTITINGIKQKLAAPAFLQKAGKISTPYVPLTVIAAAMKYDIAFSQKLQTHFINPQV